MPTFLKILGILGLRLYFCLQNEIYYRILWISNFLLNYLPIIFQFIFAMGFVVTTMLATHLLGPKRKSDVKNATWECGIEEQGNARTPFSVKYFLTAILFVLFDVEVIFMYPWAVNFRALGQTGFIEMLLFMVFLLFGFFYVIKRKALDWD